MAWGQGALLNHFSSIIPAKGFRLHGVTVFGSYYAGYSPYNIAFQQQTNDKNAYAGASTGVGWSTSGVKSSTALDYGVSYTRALNDTGFSNANHSVAFNVNRSLGSKWNLGVSMAGVLNNLEQFLFSPTGLSTAAAFPATLDELAAAMQAGAFSNSQFASMLTGAAVLNTPEQTFLYGDRTLSASANVGVSYAPTERTGFSFGVSAARTQRLLRSDRAEDNSVIPYTTSGTATVSWSYSLSPRTSVGVSAGSTRMYSGFQDGYMSTVEASANRNMSRRWFVQGRFGAGFIVYTRQTFVAPTGVTSTGGGGVGFKTESHTFLFSANRGIGDSYGLGAGSTLGATGAWGWHRRGSSWSLSSSIGFYRLQGSIVGPVESWSGSVGLMRSLGSHLFAGVQYGYSELPGLFGRDNLSQSGATVSLTWSPAARQ
jgi:hypothetical protein